MQDSEAGNEAVRDLRRAIVSQLQTPNVVRKASTPPELRSRDDLLDPNLGRLRDVAQPGGFRRNFSQRSQPSASATPLLQQLLRPAVCLSLVSELDDVASRAESAMNLRGSQTSADAHAVSAHNSSSSNLATAIIVTKCCFGSAFLIVPHGFKTAGLIGGPICLIVVYLFMLSGMLKLIECRRVKGESYRYQDLGMVWGPRGRDYINVGVVVLCFGFNCIWCVTCAENINMVMPDWSTSSRLFMFIPLVAPLSLVRRLKFFTATNLVGISLCVVTVIYLLFFAISQLVRQGTKPVILFDTTDLNSLLWLGACGYIFELICNVLPMYEAAADKEAMPKILVGVTLPVVLLYISFGFIFYLAFGSQTAPLATLNLPHASLAGYVIPSFFALVGVVTMPINFFIVFLSYEPLFIWSRNPLARKWSKNVVRLLIVLVTYFVTWLGGAQLQNFLALVGGVFGVNLSLMVPSCLHLSICKPKGIARVGDLVTVGVSVLMIFCSLYQSVATWK